jgi:tryptophanyl-tRNA synthetase
MGEPIKKPVLLSALQPSGHVMIGNYIGAIKNWVQLQDTYSCLFVVVDLHALTVRQDPATLRERCFEVVALYLACGIDPSASIVFIQSHVPAHAELAWILNCYTHLGQLNRMTQYKEKARRHAADVNAGLFDYPVLMAADILLHKTDLVPVGDDQKQHLELTRDIAGRFNNMYGEVFNIPEPYIPDIGARIMSLQDPDVKMSKSDSNPNNYIALLDPPEVVRKKISSAVTDSGKDVSFDLRGKPGVSNLMVIYSAITGDSLSDIEMKYRGKGYARFKKDLSDEVVVFLEPIQKRFRDINEDRETLKALLHKGAQKARENAEAIMKEVRERIGLIPS